MHAVYTVIIAAVLFSLFSWSLQSLGRSMGGKDSPPPCVSTSPVQSPKWGDHRERVGSEKSPFSRQPSPIEYVPRSKTEVNFQVHWKPGQSTSLPRECSSNYSPIRAYMECIAPQKLKCAIVGDSGVGKTSMLMSYTVDKFPDVHAPTIYDKFSSKFSSRRTSATFVNNLVCIIVNGNRFTYFCIFIYCSIDISERKENISDSLWHSRTGKALYGSCIAFVTCLSPGCVYYM